MNTNAEHRPMASEEYHANPAIGATMLEVFRRSRREYHGRFVTKTIPAPTPSVAMQLGTLVHMRVLEPERFVATMPEPLPVTAPDGDPWNMRKPAHREAWTALMKTRPAEWIVDEETIAVVEAIGQAVLSNWHARRILERDGQPEFSIFWRDSETQLDLKCRVDWMATIPADLKTTRDSSPGEFARSCVQFGYHRSKQHYLTGLRSHLGDKDAPLVHMAVSTAAPYPVVVYDIDDLDASTNQSLGYRQWRATLTQLAECYESDDWREPAEKTIVSVRLPAWAFSEDAYSYAGE